MHHGRNASPTASCSTSSNAACRSRACRPWSTGTEEGERESWKLVLFIRHLTQLTEKELAEMEKLNPKSAGQIDEERRINDFLNGKGGR